MINREFLTPGEIAEEFIVISEAKAGLSLLQKMILGILAGAFIALAAVASNTASFQLFNLSGTLGISKFVGACIFSGGLVLVVICGGELFTGNNLMIIGVLEKKIKISKLLLDWTVVYFANLIGSILIAYLIYESGQLDLAKGMLGGATIKIATAKTSLSPGKAIILGILCNWLVCLAVWGATAARSVGSKIAIIFFPIMMFVTSGFEHSVANMYYISSGIFAKSNYLYSDVAVKLGVTPNAIDGLGWGGFFFNNLLPVTLGNIIGGVIFVGSAYWVVYLSNKNKDLG